MLSLGACGAGGSGSTHVESGHHDHDHDDDHDHEGEEGDEVELSQEQMDAVGIRLGGFEARSLSETVQAPGRLEISAAAEGVVAPRIAGTVTRLQVREGQQVRAGEVVAWIDAPEVAALRQQVAEAARDVETARREVERQEALAAQGAGVRRNLDAARAELSMASLKLEGARGQLAVYGVGADSRGTSLPVKSGVSGVVTAIDVPVGGYADRQSPIVRVINTDGVYCMLQVPDKDISSIKAGMDVDMQLTNDPSRSFAGKVVQVSPVMDMESRTVPVRVSVSGVGSPLIPGMAVSARISVGGTLTEALPEEAIVASGGRSYIFVLESDHHSPESPHAGDKAPETFHFRRVEVASGATALGYTAVTPLGELPGDARVVVAGAFYLNSMLADHGEHNH